MTSTILFNYLISLINLYIFKVYSKKFNLWISGFTAGMATSMLIKELITHFSR